MSFKRILFLFLAVFSLSTNCVPWAAIRKGVARFAAVAIGAGELDKALAYELLLNKSSEDIEPKNKLSYLAENEDPENRISLESANKIKELALIKGLNPENIYLAFRSGSTDYFALAIDINKKSVLILPQKIENPILKIMELVLPNEATEDINMGAVEHELSHIKNNDNFKNHIITKVPAEIIFFASILATKNPFFKVLTLTGIKHIIAKIVGLNAEQRADEDVQEHIKEMASFLENFFISQEGGNSIARHTKIIKSIFAIHPSTESRIIRLKERLWGKNHPEEYAKLMEQREQEDNARKMLL